MCERICITEQFIPTTVLGNIEDLHLSLLTARKMRDVFSNELSIGEIQKMLVVNSCTLVKGAKGVVNFAQLSEEEKQTVATPPTGKYYKYGFVDFVWSDSAFAQTLKRELQKNQVSILSISTKIQNGR